MANNERTRAAAQAALDVYRATPGFEVDEETALSDLVADLMHLADSKDIDGEYIADKARGDYLDEVKETRVAKTYDHEARPDDLPEPGDRCKDCGEDITWMGPGWGDWLHVDDEANR